MTSRHLLAFALSLVVCGSSAFAQKPGNVNKGKEVFEQCAVCHSANTDEKKLGPSLKGLYKKEKMANGQKPSDAAILAMINKGKGSMPAFADVLSGQEKNDVIAYLKTL